MLTSHDQKILKLLTEVRVGIEEADRISPMQNFADIFRAIRRIDHEIRFGVKEVKVEEKPKRKRRTKLQMDLARSVLNGNDGNEPVISLS